MPEGRRMSEDNQPALPAGLLGDESPAADIPAKFRRADYELEFIRKLHIQALVQADRAQGLSEVLLKQIASYLKLLDSQLKVWASLAKTDPSPLAADLPVAEIWKILSTLPELAPILERRDVQEAILTKLEKTE